METEEACAQKFLMRIIVYWAHLSSVLGTPAGSSVLEVESTVPRGLS